MAKAIYVVPHGEEWAWRREGSKRVSGLADTQGEAIKEARSAAQNDGSELVILRPNGQIRAKDSHGNDPYPPPG